MHVQYSNSSSFANALGSNWAIGWEPEARQYDSRPKALTGALDGAKVCFSLPELVVNGSSDVCHQPLRLETQALQLVLDRVPNQAWHACRL